MQLCRSPPRSSSRTLRFCRLHSSGSVSIGRFAPIPTRRRANRVLIAPPPLAISVMAAYWVVAHHFLHQWLVTPSSLPSLISQPPRRIHILYRYIVTVPRHCQPQPLDKKINGQGATGTAACGVLYHFNGSDQLISHVAFWIGWLRIEEWHSTVVLYRCHWNGR